MAFEKICIIGTGLIGGSLALAFKRKGVGKQLIGIDHQNVIEKAVTQGIVDQGYEPSSLEKGIAGAELIVLATPIHQILELLPSIARIAPKGVLVTDVGSTKEQIVQLARKEFHRGAFFLGGHPMAGSEKSGLDAADPFLFENCFYILTPTVGTPTTLVNRLVTVLEKIGAKVLFLDAAVHDQIAAAVSHLPQILAVCLVNFIEKYNQPHYLKLAAGGFRDMTRIASSPFYLWQDICQTNSENIIQVLNEFIEELNTFKKDFSPSGLREQFEKAAKTRLSIPRDTKGFVRPQFDIAVVVEDKPGVIARIATTLADRNINIRDIEVLKVRLWEGGTLRLSFETEADRELALSLLKEKGFICQKR
ncbi:MAG: prephenate dehydrogenase [candidate division KSB1 bacterium]|nr:prephenate dehydrogenase [candidate division KSB1 bacterium]